MISKTNAAKWLGLLGAVALGGVSIATGHVVEGASAIFAAFSSASMFSPAVIGLIAKAPAAVTEAQVALGALATMTSMVGQQPQTATVTGPTDATPGQTTATSPASVQPPDLSMHVASMLTQASSMVTTLHAIATNLSAQSRGAK